MTERFFDVTTERDHLRSLLNQVCNTLDRHGGSYVYNDVPVGVAVMAKELDRLKAIREWLKDKSKRGNVFSVKAALDFISNLEETP